MAFCHVFLLWHSNGQAPHVAQATWKNYFPLYWLLPNHWAGSLGRSPIMKKRGRRARLPDASCQTTPAQTVVTVVKKPGRRGRPKNALRVAQSSVSSDGDVDKGDGSALQSNAWLAAKTETNEQPVNRPRPTGESVCMYVIQRHVCSEPTARATP